MKKLTFFLILILFALLWYMGDTGSLKIKTSREKGKKKIIITYEKEKFLESIPILKHLKKKEENNNG